MHGVWVQHHLHVKEMRTEGRHRLVQHYLSIGLRLYLRVCNGFGCYERDERLCTHKRE